MNTTIICQFITSNYQVDNKKKAIFSLKLRVSVYRLKILMGSTHQGKMNCFFLLFIMPTEKQLAWSKCKKICRIH